MKREFFSGKVLWSDTAILIYIALAKLLIHLITSTGYGYFGDELYYLGMMKHLDFGYVDIPPLVPFLMFISNKIVGTSLFALHILPAIAGAVMVYFAGLTAREMGGGRFAQFFSALMVLVSPIWLMFNSWFAYDPFDQLCTVILIYSVVRILKQESPKRWIAFGIILGIGIMTKLSMMFTGFALLVAFLLTNRRKSFATLWPWLAALIAFVICTPYVIWQLHHGWPLLTYWHNYALYRPHQEPLQFITEQLIILNPLVVLVGILGLGYLLFHREGKTYRVLGFVYLILLIYFMGIMKLESRMLISAYFPLLAAGAVFTEKLFQGKSVPVNPGKKTRWSFVKPVYICLLLCVSFILTPITLPVLPPTVLENYIKVLNSGPNSSNFPSGIPFIFSFRLGWPEMVKEIAEVYQSLPADERQKCVIYTGNYEEAGAINFFGKAYGLPDAISNHLTYQIWGPGDHTAEVVIAFGKRFAKIGGGYGVVPLYSIFNEVTHVRMIKGHKYGTFFEQDLPVYICRKPTTSLKEAWKWFEFYY